MSSRPADPSDHPEFNRRNLSLNIRGLAPSATLAINEKSARLQAQGREIFRLGLGQSPFPVPETVVQALRDNAHQKDYLAVKGLPRLREAIAAHYQRREGIGFDLEDVLIAPGSKELMFLLQLVHYADLVIPSPGWVSYAPQAAIIGRTVHWLETNEDKGWRLDAKTLDAHCRSDPTRPRLLILNYPNNPSGTSYSKAELKELAAVARRYRLIVLSDEIYAETRFEGDHVSLARYYGEGAIISGGLSKWAGAGGWRLGCFVFPKQLHWLRDAIAVAASETFTSTSAPVQHAAIAAYEDSNELGTYVLQSRRILKQLAGHIHREFVQAGLKVAAPDGGFYMLPSFETHRETLAARGISDSATLAARLLEETGVAVLPGADFGLPPDFLAIRIAFVDFDGAKALEAAGQIPDNTPLPASFLRENCPRMVEATKRIVDWLKD